MTHRKIWLKLALLAMLGFPSLASAARFDCDRATTNLEQAICNDPTLSRLDGAMAAAYEQANKRAGAHADILQRDQSLWLAKRDTVFSSNLTEFYNRRIALLDRMFTEPTSPAGFDCGKAVTVPEKFICADPTLSELDGKMTAVLEEARKRAGSHADVLARDQLLWLAKRNRSLSDSHYFDAGRVAQLYNDRIALLDDVFKEPASPLLAAIIAQASTFVRADAWDALTSSGTVFGYPDDEEHLSAERIKKQMVADFDAGPALTGLLRKVDDIDLSTSKRLVVVKLDSAHMGGIYDSRSSLACPSWITLFRWQGRVLAMLPVPKVLQDNPCPGFPRQLVVFQDQVYAMGISSESFTKNRAERLDVWIQPYAESGWGKAEHLVLSYDRALTAPASRCILKNCGNLIEQARNAIERFDRSGETLPLAAGPLSIEQTRHFEAMRRKTTGYDGDDDIALPEFRDGGPLGVLGDSVWAGDAVDFPLYYQDEVLLARIGHTALPHNSGYDPLIEENRWLLAAWRQNRDEPVLGMSVTVTRGNFLLGASVP